MTDINRREFLRASVLAASAPLAACVARPMPVRTPNASLIPAHETGTVVNDVHSQLNLTRVDRIVKPAGIADLQAAVSRAASEGRSVSIAGGRHAMGGQQFGDGSVLVDYTGPESRARL